MGSQIAELETLLEAEVRKTQLAQQEICSVQCQMHSQTTELKALLEDAVGKTQLAQQQQMTAQAEHKAAQADLAEQLRDAASLIHQLDTRQIQLLSQVLRCLHNLAHSSSL